MRIFGALFLVVLLAAAAALYLHGRDAVATLGGVAKVAESLREEHGVKRAFDRRAAKRAVADLEALAAYPEALASHVAELKAIGSTAASWTRSAPSPSSELAAAVAIRGAAAELRAYALSSDGTRLNVARDRLADARRALAGDAADDDSLAAVRQGLANIERSQQEPLLELDEDLAR
jgi:hypothetical protein